jgi:hypothetical protein
VTEIERVVYAGVGVVGEQKNCFRRAGISWIALWRHQMCYRLDWPPSNRSKVHPLPFSTCSLDSPPIAPLAFGWNCWIGEGNSVDRFLEHVFCLKMSDLAHNQISGLNGESHPSSSKKN